MLLAMLAAAVFLTAPTVRLPAIPEEEPEREAAAEVRRVEVAAPYTEEPAAEREEARENAGIRAAAPDAAPEAIQDEDPEEAAQAVWREDVPLRPELQQVLLQACEAAHVPPTIALGLIETESSFQETVRSSTGDYGLCQLNERFFPTGLTPEENLRTGIGYLGQLLERYGDPAAALTAYNRGRDDGSRSYANAVLAKAIEWGYTP